jgi:hypothetical protein
MRLKNTDDMDEAEELQNSIRSCEERSKKYEGYVKQLDESGGNEISETDPDARLMGNNKSGGEEQRLEVSSKRIKDTTIMPACINSDNKL